MARLEDLTRGASVKGVLPDSLVTVVDVNWTKLNKASGSAGVFSSCMLPMMQPPHGDCSPTPNTDFRYCRSAQKNAPGQSPFASH